MLQKVKLGQQTFTLPSTVMSSVVPQFGLFEMPYLVQDRDHVRRIAEEVVKPELYPLAEEQGYKIIGIWENGFRNITNNVRPINVPEDLEGIKLRTPKGKWRVRMFEEYGANPTPMAFSEVFVALETGTMDGQENPMAQIASAKFHEVQDYLTLTDPVHFGLIVTLNLSIGQQTPPVASVLMTACSVAKADIWDVTRANIPFVTLLLCLLLLVTYVPIIPMGLVEFFYR